MTYHHNVICRYNIKRCEKQLNRTGHYIFIREGMQKEKGEPWK